MLHEESLGSAYGPIRVQTTMGYAFAQKAAKHGAITRDGHIGAGLYERLQAELIEPIAKYIGEGVRLGELPQDAVAEALARVLILESWVPLFGQYELSGRQIFDLHDGLTEMLLHTELGEATLETLHLPYDAFFVRFGKQEGIKVPFDETRFEFVDGAFVASAQWDEQGNRRIKIGFTTVHEDGTGVDYPGPFIDILPEEMRLPVPQGIEAAIKRNLDKYAENEAEDESDRAIKAAQLFIMQDAAHMLTGAASLLVNALFYLESVHGSYPALEPGRDTPPNRVVKWMQTAPQKRDKQRTALAEDGYALVRLVGTEVAAEQRAAVALHGTIRVHWRRGHWRQQPYGTERAMVKRIWIKPVLVGKNAVTQETPIPGHLYVTGPSDHKH